MGVANDVSGLPDSKLDKAIDGIIRKYVTETFDDGTNWSRKWSDGRVEQGGMVGASRQLRLSCQWNRIIIMCNYRNFLQEETDQSFRQVLYHRRPLMPKGHRVQAGYQPICIRLSGQPVEKERKQCY